MRFLNKESIISWLKSENCLVALSLFFVALLYTYKILLTDDVTVPYSFDYTIYPMYAKYQHNTLAEHGQFPLWSNMFQMGYPIYADWSSSLYYPFTTPFFFAFGPITGIKIILLVHVFLSGVGFWYYSRFLTENKLPRYFGALLFMLCGALAGRMTAGHLNHLLPFPWIPVTLYFLHNALDTRQFRYALYSMISFSFFVLASIALFIYFCFLFAVFAFFQVFHYNSGKRFRIDIDRHKLLILFTIAIFTSLIFAIKLVPIMNYSGGMDRPHSPLYGSAGIGDIFSFFGDSSPGSTFPVGLSEMEDYNYLGILPLMFLPFSMFHKSPQKKYLIVGLVVFILWAMGYFTVFGVVHLVSVLQNLSVPPRSLILGSFCLISLIVLGFDWFVEKYGELDTSKKKYVWLLFGSISAVISLEMITPLGVYLFIPDNYDAYRYFTRNEFTLATLGASVLLVVTLVLAINHLFLGYDLKRFLIQIVNPRTFRIAAYRALNNQAFISTFLVVFIALNLLVVNSARFDSRLVYYHDDRLEDRIADDINADDPEHHPWLNDSYYPFVDSHFLSYQIPMYSAGVAGWLEWHERYYPGNITVGNMTYSPYNYEITDEEGKANATLIKEYTVINRSAWERDRQFTDTEPASVSGVFSGGGSEEVGDPGNITLYLYRLNNSLPDVFIVRDETVIPLTVTELTPHRIEARASNIQTGDVIVFKNSWYDGWKVSIGGGDTMGTEPYQRLNSVVADRDYGNASVTFTFEPSDFRLGVSVSFMFIPAITILYLASRKGYLSFLRTGMHTENNHGNEN